MGPKEFLDTLPVLKSVLGSAGGRTVPDLHDVIQLLQTLIAEVEKTPQLWPPHLMKQWEDILIDINKTLERFDPGTAVFSTPNHHDSASPNWQQLTSDRDRGPGCPGAPPTPPGMRVRTRRLSTSFRTLAEAKSQAIESRPPPQMIDHRTVVRPLAGTTSRDARGTYLLVSLRPFPSPLVLEGRYYGRC